MRKVGLPGNDWQRLCHFKGNLTNRNQQQRFTKFLNANSNVQLMGTELDWIDPYHRLYSDNRNHVLGVMNIASMNATISEYETARDNLFSSQEGMDIGLSAHSLLAWQGLNEHPWINPEEPERAQWVPETEKPRSWKQWTTSRCSSAWSRPSGVTLC